MCLILKKRNEDDKRLLEDRPKELAQLKLPLIKLIEYDGEPRTWLAFWNQFSRIDSDGAICKEDKYQYLLQSLKEGSKPRTLVTKFQPSGYEDALEHLKARFGNREVLVEIYVRDLIKLILDQKQGHSVTTLYDQIESYLRALDALDIERKVFSPVLYPLIESCLSKDLILMWERWRNFKTLTLAETLAENDDKMSLCSSSHKVQVSGATKLELLMAFLRQEAEGEERAKLAKQFRGETKEMKEGDSKAENMNRVPAALDLVNMGLEGKSKSCVFCNRNSHAPQNCNFAKKLTFEKKLEIIKKSGACMRCLRVAGHLAKDCTAAFVECDFCTGKHYLILCKDFKRKTDIKECGEEKTLDLLQNSNNHVILQTLCVLLKSGKKRKLCRALCDSGSQQSYIVKRVADEMGFVPVGSKRLNHLGQTIKKNCTIFTM